MFSSFDKALVALVMGAFYIMNNTFGISFGMDEQTLSAVIAALTPILVWLIPNKAA